MFEQIVDRLLDYVFGGIASELIIVNILIGAVVFIAGFYFVIKASRSGRKSKRKLGFSCIGVGSLIIGSGTLQLFF